MFPDLHQANDWYTVTLDGLRYLKTAIHSNKRTTISDATMDVIGGMTEAEWRTFTAEREDEHEMFASLALLAACEGGIRRDMDWRGGVNVGQLHHVRFKPLAEESHVAVVKIIDTWQGCLGQGHYFRKQLNDLRQIYSDRNVLAHGRANRGQYSFSVIFSKLLAIQNKWAECTPDFKGF